MSVQSLGPKSILVSWSPIDVKDVNGVLQGYYVNYKHVSSRKRRSISTGYIRVSNMSASSVEIKGLQPFSLYDVAVSGFTKTGRGPWSPAMKVRTQEEGW